MYNADFVLEDLPWTKFVPFSSFDKSWKYGKEVYTCFVDLEKAYDRVPREKLWIVILEYDMRVHLLDTIESLYKESEVCFRVNDMKTNPFSVSVGLRQGWVFLLFCSLYTWTR